MKTLLAIIFLWCLVANAAKAATITVYPDPGDPGTTSIDGYARRTGNQSFSSIRTGAGTSHFATNAEDPFMVLTSSTDSGNPWTNMRRSLYGFDTSALTSGASISGATFSVYSSTLNNPIDNFSQSVGIVAGNTASSTTIANSDYELNVSTTLISDTTYTVAGWPTTGSPAYQDFALNATGLGIINKTGITKIAGESSADYTNTEPTWSSFKGATVSLHFADQAGTANDPKLVVTYSTSSPASVITRVIIID